MEWLGVVSGGRRCADPPPPGRHLLTYPLTYPVWLLTEVYTARERGYGQRFARRGELQSACAFLGMRTAVREEVRLKRCVGAEVWRGRPTRMVDPVMHQKKMPAKTGIVLIRWAGCRAGSVDRSSQRNESQTGFIPLVFRHELSPTDNARSNRN